jgi:hypothetical protein
MIKGISAAALSIFIGACATSGPEAPEPAATAPSETASAVASDSPAAPSGDATPELDTSGAQELASAEPEYDPNEVICRRERESGSNFYRKTCYTRAQLEARQEQDQDALRQMRSMRSGGQQDTNPGGG